MTAEGVGGRSESLLAGYEQLTRSAMLTWLEGGQPDAYLYDLVRDYPLRQGKGLRAALLLATCEAFGRSAARGLSSAVSLELLHNAFLVHDDLEDESLLRRGAPALHELHGVPLAVNAGDALASLALRPMVADQGLGPGPQRAVLREMLAAVRKTTEGQATDLGWRRHRVVDMGPEDYLELVGKKTCWYSTVTPLRVGAIIGEQREERQRLVSAFGFYLGVAFQVRDDLLDLEASGCIGKEPYRDIREGKRTLMLIHLLSRAGSDDRVWLHSFLDGCERERRPGSGSYGSDGSREDDVRHVVDLFAAYGCVHFAWHFARALQAAARRAFDDAFEGVASTPNRDFIESLIDYVLDRSY